MSRIASSGNRSFAPRSKELDRRIEAFQNALNRGQRPPLDDFLLAETAVVVLIELVHVELEFRLKQGEAAQVEEYLTRYPRLADDPAVVAELAIAEYTFRQRCDRGLDWESYVQRFPVCRNVLAERFRDLNVSKGLNQVDPLPHAASSEGDVTVAAGVTQGGASAADYPCIPGYELLSELGRGGMGVVYQARQTALGRTVALKMVLHAERAGSETLSRFRTEAEAVARLQHPHIVQVFEVGEHNGLPYFSLEFRPGGSLAARLDGTPWEAKAAARLVETLAHATQAAHQAKVVHRDLKPANVLLAADGQAKIADFGLAKKLDEQGQTQTGSVLGTPSYMAPEQAGGRIHAIGPATDVYALGAILYELLTGRPPFRGVSLMDTLRQVRESDPVPPRRLQPRTPRDLETICLKCLHKEPHKRYPTAQTLAEDLQRFQAGEPVQARPVSGPERAVRWTRRHPAVAILLVAIFLIAATIPLALVAHTMRLQEALNREQQERERAGRAERVAQINEAAARVSNFAADLHLAHNLFKAGDVFQLPGLLDPHRREGGAANDPRGFAWWYLKRHSQTPRPGLEAHDGPLRLLRYSPDGRSLITSGGSPGKYILKVWDRTSGRLHFSRPLHRNSDSGNLSLAAYAPGGAVLAGITERAIVTLWDADSGEQRLRLPQNEDAYSIALSPDGRRLAVSSVATTSMWNCTTGQQEAALPIPDVWAHLAFAPDGKTLAVEAVYPSFHGLQWWDLASGRAGGQAHSDGAVSSLAFSPRGTFLLLVYHDSRGAIWDATHRIPLHWSDTIGPCSSLAVSADERTLAVGGPDGQVHLRDISTGRLRGRYRWQGNPIVQVAFSPDNRTLAAATAEGQVREMDATVEHFPDQLQTFAVKDSLCWSPDGETMAVTAWGGTVHLFDRRTGAERRVLCCPAQNVRCQAFAPDGRTLATSCNGGDRIVRLWDTISGRLRATTAPELAEASALAFSPDGRRLASAVGKRVRFWDAATGKAQDTLEAEQPIFDLAFTPDSRSLLTASQTIEAWDLSGNGPLPRKPVSSARGTSATFRLAVSRDGRRVATGQSDGAVRVWWFSADRKLSADEAELPLTREGSVTSLGFGPDNRTLLVGTLGMTRLCDVSTRGRHHDSLSGALSQGALSPDGRTLALIEDGGIVRLWDLASWRVRRPAGQVLNRVASLVFSTDGCSLVTAGPIPSLRIQNRKLIAAETAPLRNTTESLRFWDAATRQEMPLVVPGRETMTVPYVVARSPDGRLLAAGAEDGSISIWDWSKGQWLRRLFITEKARLYAETCELARRVWTNSKPEYWRESEAILALAFSPDGRSMAASGNRGSIGVWQTDDWKERGHWSGTADGSPWLTFAPDGGGVVGSRAGQVCVWDAHSGEVRTTLGDETDSPVLCGVFAPGKEVLAIGSKDGAIRLWEPRGGEVKRLPGGHQDRVTSLAFTPDGKTLASGSWDRTVRLWNTAASREVAALEGHKGRVNVVAFTPDGAVLASGGESGESGEVLLWRR